MSIWCKWDIYSDQFQYDELKISAPAWGADFSLLGEQLHCLDRTGDLLQTAKQPDSDHG